MNTYGSLPPRFHMGNYPPPPPLQTQFQNGYCYHRPLQPPFIRPKLVDGINGVRRPLLQTPKPPWIDGFNYIPYNFDQRQFPELPMPRMQENFGRHAVSQEQQYVKPIGPPPPSMMHSTGHYQKFSGTSSTNRSVGLSENAGIANGNSTSPLLDNLFAAAVAKRQPLSNEVVEPLPLLSVEVEDENSGGGVLIYIDNSNIWINTMEASAKKLEFKSDIKQDLRTRVNIVKLLTLAAAERPIIRAVLYGSEPPPISKFWNNIKEIKFCRVDVQVTRRSTYSNREREVDQSIMLDIGVDLVTHHNHTKYGGTIILFTGDGGMMTAVRRALEYNWNVELWTYRNSLAKGYLEETEKNPKFKIVYLDDHFENFVFYKFEWKIRIPQERSCVLTLRQIPDALKSEILELFVKAFSHLARMPMAGRYFKVGDDYYSEKKSTESHLVIVCSVGKLILKEDSRSDFFHKYKSENGTQQSNNHQLHPGNNKKKVTSFHFTPEQWERVPDILNLAFLKEDPGDFNTEVKAEFEALVDECLRHATEAIDNPKYDFNTEVYRRIEETISIVTPANATVNCSRKFINSPTKSSNNNSTIHKTTNSPTKSPTPRLPSAIQDQIEPIIQKYKPKLRSLPQFLQDLKLTEHEDFEPLTLEAQGTDDDGEGNFTVQMFKKQKKKFQQYSEYCKYSYRCGTGFKCRYNHTDKEKEFFKLQPNSLLRKTYKFKSCDHYANSNCKFKKGTSYMCPFSHGYFCTTCKIDEDGGHNIRTCSVPPLARTESALQK